MAASAWAYPTPGKPPAAPGSPRPRLSHRIDPRGLAAWQGLAGPGPWLPLAAPGLALAPRWGAERVERAESMISYKSSPTTASGNPI